MAQHVTFFRMKVLPGKLDELMRLMQDDANEERRLNAAGWEGTIVGKSKDNPDVIWTCVTWDNSENYRKNADSPEQDAWYRKMRVLLAADPEWHDADVIEEQRA